MGRKRQIRKRAERVHSKTSLNSGIITSDSESEASVVSRKQSQTVIGLKNQTNVSAHPDINVTSQLQGTGTNLACTSNGPQNHDDQSQCNSAQHEVMGAFVNLASQENIHIQPAQQIRSDTCQNSGYTQSGDNDTDQAAHYTINAGHKHNLSQSDHNLRYGSAPGTLPGTQLHSVRYSRNDSDTDQTMHAHSTRATASRAYISRETMHSGSFPRAQVDTCLGASLRLGENSETDHATHLNPTSNTNQEYSGSQRYVTLPNTHTGAGPRSSPITQTVGSGDTQTNQETLTSVLQDFCSVMCRQIQSQNELQNSMFRDCLTGVTTAVSGLANQFSSLSGQIDGLRQANAREATTANQSGISPNTVTPNVIPSSTVAHNVRSHNCEQTDLRETTTLGLSSVSQNVVPSLTLSPASSTMMERDTCTSISTTCRPNQSSQDATMHIHCDSNMQSVVPASVAGHCDSSSVIVTPHAHCNTNTSPSNMLNANTAANQTRSHDAFSSNKVVKLPSFTGNGNDNWKIWYSRFTQVANLNNWDDATRLSELMQRLQGTAAEFAFDEIPQAILSNFHSLVNELGLRFQSVETNKTFRVQFGKRAQRIGESVEDYSAELKRIYDKAYPGRNPEMRRQLLLQQFLSGLRDKQAKFAVEYFKEPCTIEDAVHNVVTYMEAQQSHKFDTYRSADHSKSVRFLSQASVDDDDESSDNDAFVNTSQFSKPPPSSSELGQKQTVRKVQTTQQNSELNLSHQLPEMITRHVGELVNLIKSSGECVTKESSPGKSQTAPPNQGPTSRLGQLRPQNPNQGQTARSGRVPFQQQGQGQSGGQNRLANMQCFHCANFGHIKRDCPILQAEQTLLGANVSQVNAPQPRQGASFAPQGPVNRQNIALN